MRAGEYIRSLRSPVFTGAIQISILLTLLTYLLTDEVHKAINNKQFTLSVMIDLEKAFDFVWLQGLLYKMKQLGLRGKVLKFVEDFLMDCSIQVRVGAVMSSTYFVEMERPMAVC